MKLPREVIPFSWYLSLISNTRARPALVNDWIWMLRTSLAVSLILFAFLAQSCATARELITPYPTDAELEARFYKHKDDFDELVRLLEEDSNVWMIDSNLQAWVDRYTLAELPKDRIEKYRKLIFRTGALTITRGYLNENKSQDGAIFIWVWDISTYLLEGKRKFYVYKHADDTKLLDSLDELHASGRVVVGYKKINEDWRLFLDVY